MLPVGRKCLSEDEALGPVAVLIDAIDARGLAAIVDCDTAGLEDAMTTLGSPSCRESAVVVAEALVQKAYEAFHPTLRRFQKDMEAAATVTESAKASLRTSLVVPIASQPRLLREFCHVFTSVRQILLSWCTRLRVVEAVDAFTTNVRCALMQPDVISDEIPRGRRELLAFLFSYGRRLLRMESFEEDGDDEEEEDPVSCGDAAASSAGPCALEDDAVLRCLDELGMSNTREVRHLWYGLLVECMEEEVSTLDDDYTEPALPGYLTWEEQTVGPFIHATLSRHDPQRPSSRPASGFLGSSDGFLEPAPTIEIGSRKPNSADRHDAPIGGGDGSGARGTSKDRWCAELHERLLVSFARKRIASFWDIMVEYPDSVPALEDLRSCLQACPHGPIKEELTRHLRHMLSTRLHRAGTRTEDILVMLSKAVNSLWVLVPRNEQSSVIFSVVSDTLEHLRRRRDCVPAVVQVLTQAGGDTALHAAYGGIGGVDGYDAADDPASAAEGDADVLGGGASGGRERPDILRILLTAVPVRALAEEYQHALAQHLLSKELHNFDTTPEEEVLERLKCVLGGDVMPQCEVMVHDIQSSKRTTNQLREQLEQRVNNGGQNSPTVLPPRSTSLDVLSLTVWPKLKHCLPAGEPVPPPDTYRCHPSLQAEMDRLSEAYKLLKQGQKLSWTLSQGRVSLDVKQQRSVGSQELVTTSYVLSLFSASVLLYMLELDVQQPQDADPAQTSTDHGVPVEALAAKLDIPVAALAPHIDHMVPHLLLWTDAGVAEANAGPNTTKTLLRVQRVLPAASHVLFEEAGKDPQDALGTASSLDEEQLGLLKTMTVAMLQNGGAAPAGDIVNSLKMFTGTTLTNADMKHLMHTLVSEGSVAQGENKTYYVP